MEATHELWQTTDADRPTAICDRNGEVVLGLCMRCGKAEAELTQPCVTVADLQRELLAICRGGRWADTWRQLNAPVEWPLTNLGKRHRIAELRKRIAAIDPNAALYYGWAGPDDEAPHRRKGDER